MLGSGFKTAAALLARLLAPFCLAAGLAAATPAAAQGLADMVQAVKEARDGSTLFGSVEIRSDSLKGLQQWQRVISAMKTAGPAFNSCAKSAANCTSPTLKTWRRVVTAAAGLPELERIKSVNRAFNAWPYKLDIEVYGVREYWATPKEFIIRSGDCEDYSIAKYYALRNLGISKDDMRIVVLMDHIRGFGHAVTAVYTGGEILILDNTTTLVLPHSRYKHYEARVSMNETARWAHIGGAAPEPKASSSPALSASTLFQRRK